MHVYKQRGISTKKGYLILFEHDLCFVYSFAVPKPYVPKPNVPKPNA